MMLLNMGLHPAGLQGLGLPSFKTEERAQGERQIYQLFNGWGAYTSEAKSWIDISVQLMVGRTWQQTSLLGARRQGNCQL